jgi:hypothetical protein
MRRIALSLLLPLALAATAAGADTLLTMKTHTDAAALGQSNRDSEIKVWVSPDNQHLRRDEATFSLLLLLDKSKMYLVDNQTKTYNEVDLPVDFKKLDPVHGSQMAEQMQAMTKMDVSVKPTTEQKKVSSWTAKKYQVSMSNAAGMKIDSDMWMSQDVGIDSAAFAKMQAHMTSLSPGSGEWVKKLSQIPGFPVLTETRVTTPGGVIKSTQQLASVDQKPAPAGTYSLPSGYTKAPFGTMSGAPAPGRPAAPPPGARSTAPPPPAH